MQEFFDYPVLDRPLNRPAVAGGPPRGQHPIRHSEPGSFSLFPKITAGALRQPVRALAGLLFSAVYFLHASPLDAQTGETDARKRPATASTPGAAHELFIEGAYEQAIEAFQSLAADPRFTLQAALGLARCRIQIGQYSDALAALTALEADGSPEWHYLLAKLYRLTGRYEDTLSHAREAVNRNKDFPAARLLLAETLEMIGRGEEALAAYQWFDKQLVERTELPRDAEWMTDVALGFLRCSVLTRHNVPQRTRHVLHEMLQVAYERLDRTYWPARVAAGDLLREKYNNDEESGSVADYRAALRINKRLPEAFVGLGEVALDRWGFEEVEQQAEKALAVNPNFAPAIHLLAKKLLLERRYAQAIETCERALAINPNDLTALAISAAGSACQYDDEAVARQAARVAAVTPSCPLLHRTMGDALSGLRQYSASEQEYRRAIELDPADANARTELGMMYMQWGEEEKAREVLEGAWALDQFNERTKFTLELLEMLQQFSRVETPHFVIRYDPQHDPGLGEFAATYLEEISGSVTRDFDTELSEKTILEIFPTQRAFGVRITGKPWIHTIGACTGRVIAVSSPRQSTQQMGRYDLARVLKHEFTHTVTLAATRNRIPHWFTEGLAVLQEDAPRPFPWIELLADATRRDRLFTLESIDWAFIRPKAPNDRQTAYAQSEWMCEFIVESFGYDSINTLIRRFREGHAPGRVLSEQLGLTPAEFDEQFRRWAREQVARWGFNLKPPDSVDAVRALAAEHGDDSTIWGRLARAEFDAGEYERALLAARRTLELDERQPDGLEILVSVLAMYVPANVGDSARQLLDEEAVPALRRLAEVRPDSCIAAKGLSEIALRRKELDSALAELQRLQRLCPMDPASWRGLAGIYLERKDYDSALPQLLQLARIGEADAAIPSAIAGIYRRRSQLGEARFWYRAALYIDPFSTEVREAIGDVEMQAGDTGAALRQYRTLTLLQPREPRHYERAAFAAHKAGDAAQAQELARKAVELNPDSPARSLLP